MEIDKNKRYLLICESPEKAKTITGIFKKAGIKNIFVQPTVGHFDYIKDGSGYYNTGIFPEDNFKMDYAVDPKKTDVVKKLKEQIKVSDVIFLASDPDREGEAIAWACLKFLNIPKSKYYRVTYQAINYDAIMEAIKNASSLDENMVNAAHARSALDKGLGYRLSGISRNNSVGRSVGRCQSAALKMIVDREKEILNFKPETYFDLYLHFFKNNTEFKAKYVGTDAQEIKRIKDEKEIDIIINNCKGTPFSIGSIDFKDKKENPKPPFSTASFQQECANKLGLTIKQAADCAQKLFDAGKISYHRTDSEMFETAFETELKKFVKKNFDKKYVSGTVIKGKPDPNGQNGHEALHCLDLSLTPDLYAKETNNDLLVKVYRIIYNRTVATALKPAIISQTTYNIYNKENKFVMNSNELKFDGYRCVYNYKDDSEEKTQLVKETFTENEELKKCSLESIPNATKPKQRYKEASFIKELKDEGIGRPSTYATIIETVKSESRGYVTVENKYLKPTALGVKNIDFLDSHFSDLINIDYTKEMEESLDLIAAGKLDYIKFLTEFYNHLENSAKKVDKASSKTCPKCGKPLVVRKGKYGLFLGCSGYPACTYLEKLNKGDATND